MQEVNVTKLISNPKVPDWIPYTLLTREPFSSYTIMLRWLA